MKDTRDALNHAIFFNSFPYFIAFVLCNELKIINENTMELTCCTRNSATALGNTEPSKNFLVPKLRIALNADAQKCFARPLPTRGRSDCNGTRFFGL